MKLNTQKFFERHSEFQDYYIEKNQNQIEVNRDRLILTSKSLLNGVSNKCTNTLRKKIESAIDRGGYKNTTETDILTKIVNGDEVYQHMFMIDPKKQNGKSEYGQEFLQSKYLSDKLNKFEGFSFRKLPNNGKESYRISDGDIVKGIPKDVNTSKSIDYNLHNPHNLYIYTINKVTTSLIKKTKDSGGAQSNQMELAEKGCDTIDFSLEKHKNTYVLLIFDGTYYYNNQYIFNLIEKYKNNKHIYITTSDGIEEVIGSILHNK
jgi:hypothetical protein